LPHVLTAAELYHLASEPRFAALLSGRGR
jgi:hypothetical protein